MRKQARSRVRRSESEWAEILDHCRASGQSQAAYCRANGLSKSSFEHWKKRLRRSSSERGRRQQGRFLEWSAGTVGRSQSSSSGSIFGELELSLPGGVVLRWKP